MRGMLICDRLHRGMHGRGGSALFADGGGGVGSGIGEEGERAREGRRRRMERAGGKREEGKYLDARCSPGSNTGLIAKGTRGPRFSY